MPVLLRWAKASIDPVIVLPDVAAVTAFVREKGYAQVPAFGLALELTEMQWDQLKDDIKAGRV